MKSKPRFARVIIHHIRLPINRFIRSNFHFGIIALTLSILLGKFYLLSFKNVSCLFLVMKRNCFSLLKRRRMISFCKMSVNQLTTSKLHHRDFQRVKKVAI